MKHRGHLVFVSTRFLFPTDSGGKIRTTQVLRGLKGGAFQISLLSPASAELVAAHQEDLESVCDEFRWWSSPHRGRLFPYTRMRYLASSLPIPVRTDFSQAGRRLVRDALEKPPTVAVFDFAHAGVLLPPVLGCPSVLFTHNVEAEIFRRHRDVAGHSLVRAIWANQHHKMREFERRSLQRFDVVVAVADRDAKQFSTDYGVTNTFVIPTGVDLDFFAYSPPVRRRDAVFLGSMDWMANQQGMTFFMDEVWDHIAAAVPDAKMTVVGRSPPARLVKEARRRRLNWTFTGFVEDVRPHVQGAAVSVIPLRVGGGTRLKVFEAMAMGSPIVSTGIGVEGLAVEAGQHYLQADDPVTFADAVVGLMENDAHREQLARGARTLVEEHFSYVAAARAFEDACQLAIDRHEGRAA